jgi:hypothetical protein
VRDTIEVYRAKEAAMTNQDAFTADEWTLVREAPTSAGLIVVTASRGGTLRETFAMSKAYVEARAEHGNSELLDEVVGSKPKMDHPHPHTPEELSATALQHIRDAIALLETKATEQEVEDYRPPRARPRRQPRRSSGRGADPHRVRFPQRVTSPRVSSVICSTGPSGSLRTV